MAAVGRRSFRSCKKFTAHQDFFLFNEKYRRLMQSKPTIMKKTLLLLVMTSCITVAFSQKRKKTDQPLTGYAITAVEKGGRSWKEVRLVNITTGEEVKSIYQSKQEIEAFNARTGNPVVKKDVTATKAAPTKKVVNLDQELAAANGNVRVKTIVINHSAIQYDKPFATNSAAMA